MLFEENPIYTIYRYDLQISNEHLGYNAVQVTTSRLVINDADKQGHHLNGYYRLPLYGSVYLLWAFYSKTSSIYTDTYCCMSRSKRGLRNIGDSLKS